MNLYITLLLGLCNKWIGYVTTVADAGNELPIKSNCQLSVNGMLLLFVFDSEFAIGSFLDKCKQGNGESLLTCCLRFTVLLLKQFINKECDSKCWFDINS